MKVPPDHYKGLQATSKEHAPVLIPVAAVGRCKQANEFQSCHLWSPYLIHYSWVKLAQFAIQGCSTLKPSYEKDFLSSSKCDSLCHVNMVMCSAIWLVVSNFRVAPPHVTQNLTQNSCERSRVWVQAVYILTKDFWTEGLWIWQMLLGQIHFVGMWHTYTCIAHMVYTGIQLGQFKNLYCLLCSVSSQVCLHNLQPSCSRFFCPKKIIYYLLNVTGSGINEYGNMTQLWSIYIVCVLYD